MKVYEIITENTSVKDMARLNNIKDVNKIRLGQRLKLPDGSVYTVAKGDTLSNIAAGKFKGPKPKPAEPAAKADVKVGRNPNIDNDTRQRSAASVKKQTEPEPDNWYGYSDPEADLVNQKIKSEPAKQEPVKQKEPEKKPEPEVPANVVRSADGTPVRTGTGGYVTTGTAAPDPKEVAAIKARLTPSQIKWLRGADPTDPAIMARMPDPLPGEKPVGVKTKPDNVRIKPEVELDGVSDDLLSRFYSAASEYGKPVTINSGERDDAEQALLVVRHRLGEPGIHMPAQPTTDQTITYKGKTYDVKGSGRQSSHKDGLALDITPGFGSDFEPILKKYGLHFPFGDRDKPHIQIA